MKRYFIIGLGILLAVSLSAQTVKELQQQQKELKEQIDNTNKMLQQTQKSKTSTVNKLELINRNIKNQKKLIRTIDNEIGALDREMKGLQNRKADLEVQKQQLKDQYATLVRETHYAQMQQSPLLFLLSSNSFQQLVRRIRYMMEFGHVKQDQVARIQAVQKDIDTQNDLLAANRKSKQSALKSQQKQQEQLSRDERKQKQMLEELKKKEKTLKADLAAQQKRVAALNDQIDKLIKAQAKATKNTLTKEQQLIGGDFENNKGRLPWPVEKGFISGQFGKHKHPVYDQVTIDNHGIYLQTTEGSKARAVFKGTVTSCSIMEGCYVVIIQHGNYRSVYFGLSKLQVKQGDEVVTKQDLGTIRTDAEQDNKTEMYFQIYKGTEIQNPSLWLAN